MNSRYSLASHERDYWRAAGQFRFAVNTPQARAEGDRSLPPYHGRRVFIVDEYPSCPSNWMRSRGRMTGFWVPIIYGNGLWLDFNGCAESTRYDVAVVISVQGVNPITGEPCEDANLEQYVDNCPRHKKPFGPERFCADCGYKWPKQNYLPMSACAKGAFWIDGFRDGTGKVRQYVITPDKLKGVAHHITGGKEVYAIGLSFFTSKSPRPVQEPPPRRQLYAVSNFGYGGGDSIMMGGGSMKGGGSFGGLMCCSVEPDLAIPTASLGERSSRVRARSSSASLSSVNVKQAHVGRGTELDQTVPDDPSSLDYWNNEPEAVAVINYCDDAEADAIIAGGTVDIHGKSEGFLAGVPAVV